MPSTISARHAVVEVVVHLLDELVVGQRREVDLLVLVLVIGSLRRSCGLRVASSGVPHRGTVPYDGTPSRRI